MGGARQSCGCSTSCEQGSQSLGKPGPPMVLLWGASECPPCCTEEVKARLPEETA